MSSVANYKVLEIGNIFNQTFGFNAYIENFDILQTWWCKFLLISTAASFQNCNIRFPKKIYAWQHLFSDTEVW